MESARQIEDAGIEEFKLPDVKPIKKRKSEFDLSESSAPSTVTAEGFNIKLDKCHSIELTEFRKVLYVQFKKKTEQGQLIHIADPIGNLHLPVPLSLERYRQLEQWRDVMVIASIPFPKIY